MNYQESLNAMRENVIETQAAYTDATWSRDRVSKPLTYYTDGELRYESQFRDQRVLLQRGRVVWGAITAVKDTTVAPGTGEIAVVYATGRSFDEIPEKLQEFGQQLAERVRDEARAEDGQTWKQKLGYDCKVALPSQWTAGTQCYGGNLLVSLPNLPGGQVSHWLLPLLILPEHTDASIVLPQFYWDELLVTEWLKS
jgi:hypothetical protein